MGYKLTTKVCVLHLRLCIIRVLNYVPEQDTLRRRFSNALKWYTALVLDVAKSVQLAIDRAREDVLRQIQSDPDSKAPQPPASPMSIIDDNNENEVRLDEVYVMTSD